MLFVRQILVIVLVLAGSAVGLSGCGQQGPLYLPTEAAAAHRATLPQTLLPAGLGRPAPPASAPPQ